MSKFNGKIVLITGGASGIGRIMGEMALKKGASALVIWDINQTNIDATIGEMKVLGKVVGYRVDVSDYETVASSYAKVKEEVGDVASSSIVRESLPATRLSISARLTKWTVPSRSIHWLPCMWHDRCCPT